jgi:zinc/manganese transport system substrate-binding protein
MNIVINSDKEAAVRTAFLVMAAGMVGLLPLAACGGSTAAPAGTISIVTSTSVYGDIVAQLAGPLAADKIRITSLISDPSTDPHSYEASTRTELAISRADLIVENGGGYDDFVDTLRSAAGADAPVVNVVDLSGFDSADGGLNEHVWYDFPTIEKFAKRISRFLIAHDRADAAAFRHNARSFLTRLGELEAIAARIKRMHEGDGVAITEPVPLYLLQACGLVNRTPAAFSRSVEDDTDVAPRVLQDTLALFSAHSVQLLAYNDQTSGSQTDAAIAAARHHGIPTVAVGETLPAGQSYLSWMRGLLTQISAALR